MTTAGSTSTPGWPSLVPSTATASTTSPAAWWWWPASRDRDDRLRELADFYLWLVTDAQSADGRFHNRRDLHLTWTDEPSLEDCWGRALWGLGTAARRLRRRTAPRSP